MKSFFKYVFATIIGIFLFFFISFFILFLTLVAIVPGEEAIADKSVLQLNLDKRIIERETADIFAQFRRPFGAAEPGTIGLLELRQSIKAAADNEKVKGIFLSLNNISAGSATLDELREELQLFKKSGKFIVAYSESYSEGAYYLASVADKIYLPPSGLLEFNGLNIEVLFFKNLLNKLGIEPEVFKVGQYKSAVEPFIAQEMSVSNREQLSVLLNSVYGHMLSKISASRNIPVDQLERISDSLLIRNPEDALKYKLITDIGYRNDCENFMREVLNLEKEDELSFIDDFKVLIDRNKANLEASGENKVAVLFASGDIVDGLGDERSIGSETFSEELKKVREDSSVKAVVIRINSPGGSALASDIIWKEVMLTAAVKPVIASMSDVAASGGYYIAAACDTILALPTTITGSIGVFGVLFNGKEFLNDKLGITTDKEQTGPFADIGSFTRPLSNTERKVIQQEVEEIYQKFVQVVANGRSVDTSYVNQVAQGRVWSGVTGVEKKLVDQTAGLDSAIQIAAQRANIKEYKAIYLPEPGNLMLKEILSQLSQSSFEEYLRTEAGDMYPYLQRIKYLKRMEGIQTKMPFELIID